MRDPGRRSKDGGRHTLLRSHRLHHTGPVADQQKVNTAAAALVIEPAADLDFCARMARGLVDPDQHRSPPPYGSLRGRRNLSGSAVAPPIRPESAQVASRGVPCYTVTVACKAR